MSIDIEKNSGFLQAITGIDDALLIQEEEGIEFDKAFVVSPIKSCGGEVIGDVWSGSVYVKTLDGDLGL